MAYFVVFLHTMLYKGKPIMQPSIAKYDFPILSGVPGKPSKPTTEKITKSVVKIMWLPPSIGDSSFPVIGYILEKSSQGQWVTEEQVSSSQRKASSHL